MKSCMSGGHGPPLLHTPALPLLLAVALLCCWPAGAVVLLGRQEHHKRDGFGLAGTEGAKERIYAWQDVTIEEPTGNKEVKTILQKPNVTAGSEQEQPLAQQHSGPKQAATEQGKEEAPAGDRVKAWISASGMYPNQRGSSFRKLFDTMSSVFWICFWCAIIFSVLRPIYPEVFANNERSKSLGGIETAPPIKPGYFTWIMASFNLGIDDFGHPDRVVKESEKLCGLDSALYVVFSNFALSVLTWIGVPLVVVLCPLHAFFGEEQHYLTGDWISTMGLNNVKSGSKLVWVHAVAVWYVAVVSMELVFFYMEEFVPIRYRWLQNLKPPRCNTVLVENIPENLCNDQNLAEYFQKLFPHDNNAVETAYVVRLTPRLQKYVEEIDQVTKYLEAAYHQAVRQGGSEEDVNASAVVIDKQRRLQELHNLVNQERARVLTDSMIPHDTYVNPRTSRKNLVLAPKARNVLASAGFVTFASVREVALVLNLRCCTDSMAMRMSIPPPPDDIIWDDLKVLPLKQRLLDVAGWLCIVSIFASFMRILVYVFKLARWTADSPYCPPQVGGFLLALPLQLLLSFLPTILMLVFQTFFCLKAVVWGQSMLQTVYFWFMVIFTILYTALGGDVIEAVLLLMDRPTSMLHSLSESLPLYTHFYLDFMLLRCTTHALNLTRYMNLLKFWIYRHYYGAERAVLLCEPEDQDFYGIGARSAVLAIDLTIALVFCSIQPLIIIIAIANFLLSRVCYGYLVIYAEIRKQDLGGVFFVGLLHHVQYGVMLYVLLMISVISQKSYENSHELKWQPGPWMVAFGALVYVAWCYQRFITRFGWEQVPYADMCEDTALQNCIKDMADWRALGDKKPMYRQSELYDPSLGYVLGHLSAEKLKRGMERRRRQNLGIASILPSPLPSARGTPNVSRSPSSSDLRGGPLAFHSRPSQR